jgi:hypothetical protein
MSQKTSIMLHIEGVDGSTPRLVARAELIEIFAGMAQSDLVMAHTHLLDLIARPIAIHEYIDMEARGLLELLEQHTRAVNALQALLAFRHPDELVEAHMPRREQ